MKHYYSSTSVLRLLSALLLAAALSGCSLYHRVVHPYRLPTPKPSPEFIAQQKADKKAREAREKEAKSNSSTGETKRTGLGGLFKKKGEADPEAATDVSTPSGAPVASAAGTSPTETRTLPERPSVRYDKHGMMKKKPKLERRRLHKTHKPFQPLQAIHNFFQYDLHAKPNYAPDHRPAKKEPVLAPDAAPAPNDAPGGPPAAPNAGPAPVLPPGGPPAAPNADPAPDGPPAAPDAGPKL